MTFLRWIGLLLFFALGAYGVLSSASNNVPNYLRSGFKRQPAGKAMCSVDDLAGGAIPADHLLTGWCVLANPSERVARVEFRIDEVPVAVGDSLFSRPDLVEYFGEPNYEMSGWTVHARLESLEPGRHKLFIRVIADSGDSVDLPPRQVVIR